MDKSEDPRELERKIAQASRIASSISDQTTLGRLVGWIDELRSRLHLQRERRRLKDEITKRATDLWELAGRPEGRDLEFWLEAENEVSRQDRAGERRREAAAGADDQAHG